jgi:broad specificity phosphatase PhoE
MNSKDYCNLYIVRHGETDWNIKGLVQGHTDIPLNEKGEWQAKQLARQFKKIHFDAAYSSDLLRARKTAEIIALEKKIIIKTIKALRERRFGRFEGKSWKEGKEKEEMARLWERLGKLTDKEKKEYGLEEVENNEELMGRFIPILREIAITYPQKNVLVVTHGGVMRAFLIHLGLGDENTLPSGSIKNTAYIKLISDGVEFIVKETFGIVKKLPE